MNNYKIFDDALSLAEPWHVTAAAFDKQAHRLDLSVDFPSGTHFPCPTCGALCLIHDTVQKAYRHLNFFEHFAYLTARVPRTACPKHGVLLVTVPWSRKGSGFTLYFEGLILFLAPHMTVNHMSRYLCEHDTRLWRVIHKQVDAAREDSDHSGVHRMAFDETATRRGQKYVTVSVDLDESRVLFATPGKDGSCIQAAAADLQKHGGDPSAVDTVACDMSAAFTAGIRAYISNAVITYDRFHVTKLVVEAVQETRREEQLEEGWKRCILKGYHWALVTNESNQTEKQKRGVAAITLPMLNLKTGKAYRMKLAFQTAYAGGADQLHRWCKWAERSRISAMVRVAKTIRSHWEGVVSWFTTDVTSAIMEGYNSLFQSAKSRARGYRNDSYFIDMIYLIAGKLVFTAVYPTHSKQR